MHFLFWVISWIVSVSYNLSKYTLKHTISQTIKGSKDTIAVVRVVVVHVTIVVDIEGIISAAFFTWNYPVYLSNILLTFILSYLKQFS